MVLNTTNKKAIKSFYTLPKKLETIHRNYYDYSKVVFTTMISPVIITCPVHGDFEQSLKLHLRGCGCPSCGKTKSATSLTSNKETFIKKATKIYGNFYTYDELVYQKAKEEGIITCPLHGKFVKRLDHFLRGSACPKCVDTYSGFKKYAPALLYYLEINNGEAYKIGITNRLITERFPVKDLKVIKILYTKEYELGEDAYKREQEILKTYANFKYKGSKLLESGNTELFSLDIFKNNYKDI
jgi:hypothetical protein